MKKCCSLFLAAMLLLVAFTGCEPSPPIPKILERPRETGVPAAGSQTAEPDEALGNASENPEVSPSLSQTPGVKTGTRINPLPIGATALFDGMDTLFDNYKAEITLTEVVRGDKALKMAKKGNQFNIEPEKGKEYLFAKFKIKALDSKDDAKIDINNACFELVSQDGRKYDDFVFVSGVEPSLVPMYKGAEQEGYAFFVADIEDKNPSIVFLERNDNGIWFTTDAGAQLAEGSETYTPQEEAQEILPEDAKGNRQNPFAIRETAVFDGAGTLFDTYKIELTLMEVIRGDKALKMAKKGNQFNSKPEKGKEYLFAKFKIKALDSKDDAKIDINNACFELVSQDGRKYDDFVFVSGVEPSLVPMYKGAEQEGYAFFVADIEDKNPSIVFLERNDGGIWFTTAK